MGWPWLFFVWLCVPLVCAAMAGLGDQPSALTIRQQLHVAVQNAREPGFREKKVSFLSLKAYEHVPKVGNRWERALTIPQIS